ncbi:MAG: membrane protein insertion efficiency factor YidD [Gammaproteobacteria bacterium]|nr:membrane protein insertion efficiency factor YidD [Gammaproteobacteria bacterium]
MIQAAATLRSALSGLALTIAKGGIRAYQLTLSPFVGHQCRFHPTCSNYALAALDGHGPVKGTWLALRRLSKCHPFHPGGFDPPPAVRTAQDSRHLSQRSDPLTSKQKPACRQSPSTGHEEAL